MRHESRDTPATGRHAASSQSGVWECRCAFRARRGCREGTPEWVNRAGQQVSLRSPCEPGERSRGCVLRRPSCMSNNRYLMIDGRIECLSVGHMPSSLSNVLPPAQRISLSRCAAATSPSAPLAARRGAPHACEASLGVWATTVRPVGGLTSAAVIAAHAVPHSAGR